MLQKNPANRLDSSQCLNHSWLNKEFKKSHKVVKESIIQKLADFRAPNILQKEALTFLVNNITSDLEFDFTNMRQAFRAIDTSNTGIITREQLVKGFYNDNNVSYLNIEFVDKIFKKLDFNNTGKINYSTFLAATVDKKQALTNANILFAFNYFDTKNVGYITKEDLKEVFRRQGQSLRDEDVLNIITQAKKPSEDNNEK